jgi:hypothetical protein
VRRNDELAEGEEGGKEAAKEGEIPARVGDGGEWGERRVGEEGGAERADEEEGMGEEGRRLERRTRGQRERERIVDKVY